ncbi:hypothetical protein [Nocardia brasiliensis]|uniref:hypothetical protein n=1 Tax=Nocardia brasiliensis TaxID=37326 RepID=UPI0034009F24
MVTKRSVLSIAERMRTALAAAEPTRRSQAERIGVSPATLHRRLTGERPLLVEDLLAVALVADLAPSDLLINEDARP